MVECIRLCEDVSELGETTIALAPRRSRFAGPIVQSFLQAAGACAEECGRHSHNHCQECAQVLGETVDAAQQLLPASGQGGEQWGQGSAGVHGGW